MNIGQSINYHLQIEAYKAQLRALGLTKEQANKLVIDIKVASVFYPYWPSEEWILDQLYFIERCLLMGVEYGVIRQYTEELK